jgi:hypothetical protein
MVVTVPELFKAFVLVHICAGSVGLVTFWVPVVGRKGGPVHRRWGRLFAWMMLVTGTAALGISACTLIDPHGTHPHLPDATWVRGIFGWMMQGLALLTLNLAWYGWLCIRNQRNHAANRAWHNITLQGLLLLASLHCAYQAWRTGNALMLGMPTIGLATVATNLWFILQRSPARLEWLREHIKAMVGTGISVYTAFFAFGAVRTVPALALHPGLWSIPLVVGLALILYHRHAVLRPMLARR